MRQRYCDSLVNMSPYATLLRYMTTYIVRNKSSLELVTAMLQKKCYCHNVAKMFLLNVILEREWYILSIFQDLVTATLLRQRYCDNVVNMSP